MYDQNNSKEKKYINLKYIGTLVFILKLGKNILMIIKNGMKTVLIKNNLYLEY